MTFEYKYSAVTKTNDEKKAELEEYMKALEQTHRDESAKDSPNSDFLTNLETELTAKRTEYENLGGSFD